MDRPDRVPERHGLGHGSARPFEAQMNRLGIAGALWLVAVGFAIATTLTFRTDPVQFVLTIAVAVVAAFVGVLLIARPSALIVSASNVVAAVWTILYAVLTVQQSDELAAWTTNVFLIAVGVAAGLATYRAAARVKRA
jgi:hypothetical protein